jgi:glycosyltransferase involved in cell wall biosynthesis
MQFKLPIIATKWRGIQSIVKDAVNGYLVDIRNAEQISASIKSFQTNRNLLKTMGEKSRLMYDQEYTINRYIQQINRVFNTL